MPEGQGGGRGDRTGTRLHGNLISFIVHASGKRKKGGGGRSLTSIDWYIAPVTGQFSARITFDKSWL
ncbi:hypothetical protein HYQ46_012563 [Verticillium longisporum]|nr:hypothetical protein HYQ46_012563 [Verticillium longisporum]